MRQVWKSQNHIVILICLSVCFLGLLFYSIYITRIQGLANYTVTEASALFYAMWILLALVFISCSKKYIWIWYVYVALFGLVLIAGETTYSAIDEGAHLDYINCIIEEHKLPSMYEDIDIEYLWQTNHQENLVPVKRYEAVQVPLYYLLMAVFTGGVHNLFIRFMLIRAFGLFCLFGVLIFAELTVRLLKERKMFMVSDTYIHIVISLFGLNPGILLRFVRVSNESLAVLFSAAVSFIAIKMLVDGFQMNLYISGIAVSILLFYTKSTGACCIGAILLILLYYKKWGYFIISTVSYIAFAIPWFWHCFQLYGTLTGMNEHINIVLPMVNPEKDNIHVITGVFEIFAKAFFTPNELGGIGVFAGHLLLAVNVLLFVIIMLSIVWSIKEVYFMIAGGLRFTFSKEEKKKVLIIYASAMIFCQVALLVISARSTYINTLIGRYLYFIVIPLLILFLRFLEEANFKRTLIFVFAAFYTAIYLYMIFKYINVIGAKYNIWQNKDVVSEYMQENRYCDRGTVIE